MTPRQGGGPRRGKPSLAIHRPIKAMGASGQRGSRRVPALLEAAAPVAPLRCSPGRPSTARPSRGRRGRSRERKTVPSHPAVNPVPSGRLGVGHAAQRAGALHGQRSSYGIKLGKNDADSGDTSGPAICLPRVGIRQTVLTRDKLAIMNPVR
jgi:hypothetical protein